LAIAPALSPSQRTEFAPLLAAPVTEFEVIPELESDRTERLDGETTHDPLMRAADLGAELIPILY